MLIRGENLAVTVNYGPTGQFLGVIFLRFTFSLLGKRGRNRLGIDSHCSLLPDALIEDGVAFDD